MKWKGQKWQEMLVELRSLGLSLEAIGYQMGVGRSAVCKMIKGTIRPSVTSYQALEDFHKVSARAIKRMKA